jgi:hypothetical protein
MKTKLIVLVASVFITHASFAQFNFGAKAGANITKIEGKSFKDEFRYGYHVGGFVEIGLGGKISVQPEVLFNQFQTRVDSTFKNVYSNALNFSENKNIKLNYLSIPIVLNYKLGNVISLHAGPQFGILLDQDETILENGKRAFDKGDLSMLGGVQLKITKIRLIGRYIVGLNNINDIDDQNKWKNQGFQLSLGLAL